MKDYQMQQIINYAAFLKKIFNRESIKIVCQGDSMTYGQDTYSEDRRQSASDPTCEKNASYSYHDQASITYPEALQNFCNYMFGKNIVTVINRGYSGDWVEISRKRWKENPQADLHFLMLGTNDSSNNFYVPEEVQQNIEKYVLDMSRIIEQILDFGSFVVLLTPPKHSNNQYILLNMYRQVLKILGEKYLVPVIDTTKFLKTYPYSEVQCDDVHYNSHGYKIFAAKIAGLIAGMSHIYHPLKLYPDQIIVPSYDEYGFYFNSECSQPEILIEDKSYPFGIGSSVSDGLCFILPRNSKLTISFYTEYENLSITPLFQISDEKGQLDILLDFGVDPGISRAYKNPKYKYQFVNKRSFYGKTILLDLEDEKGIEECSFILPGKGFYSITFDHPKTGAKHPIRIYGLLVKKFS